MSTFRFPCRYPPDQIKGDIVRGKVFALSTALLKISFNYYQVFGWYRQLRI